MSFHICNGLCHWFSAMVVSEPVTCPTCPTQSTFTWLDCLTYMQLNRHPIENLHLILSLFPRPLQSLTHPSLPWCWRQNKASLCLISFSSMPVPRRSLLRPALSELFMEFPPVLLDGKREVLCWSWSGPLGLQNVGMIFSWQPTSKHQWVGSLEPTEPRLWMWGWNRTYQLRVRLKLSCCIPLRNTPFQAASSLIWLDGADLWAVSLLCSSYRFVSCEPNGFPRKASFPSVWSMWVASNKGGQAAWRDSPEDSEKQLFQETVAQGKLPSRELTYPTLGKGKSSSKCHFWGIC